VSQKRRPVDQIWVAAGTGLGFAPAQTRGMVLPDYPKILDDD
jgi:hypothetical protein